jgi:hypothetical protein
LILLRCTIGVLEWQPVGIGSYGQAVPDQAAGPVPPLPKVIVLVGRLLYPVTLENLSR